MLSTEEIADNYAEIQERIANAAARAGRAPQEITMVAVTKTWPPELILRAYEAGMHEFGENRPEELALKRPQIESELGTNNDIIWHFIGSVQSRKTAQVSDYADVFHALERLKIGAKLSRELTDKERPLQAFVEVNLSGEESKAGLDASVWESDATQKAELRKVITELAQLPGLDVVGLMTMAPWHAAPETIRQVFRRTKALAQWLETAVPQASWSMLSMGMTDDFEIAIEEGATHIRVGRALFGERSR